MTINGLVLAAGQSNRMGDFKPLMRIGAHTLLEATVGSLFAGGAEHVTVVLGHRAEEVAAKLTARVWARGVNFWVNHEYENTDMLRSIQLGVSALPPCDAFYLLPGDMPAVNPQTFRRLASEFIRTDARVIFPMLRGRRKHPPLVSARCVADILAYRGDGGIRGLWQQYGGDLIEVATEDPGCALDADTAEDLERLIRYMEAKRVQDVAEAEHNNPIPR